LLSLEQSKSKAETQLTEATSKLEKTIANQQSEIGDATRLNEKLQKQLLARYSEHTAACEAQEQLKATIAHLTARNKKACSQLLQQYAKRTDLQKAVHASSGELKQYAQCSEKQLKREETLKSLVQESIGKDSCCINVLSD
jgi:predicted kinase